MITENDDRLTPVSSNKNILSLDAKEYEDHELKAMANAGINIKNVDMREEEKTMHQTTAISGNELRNDQMSERHLKM